MFYTLSSIFPTTLFTEMRLPNIDRWLMLFFIDSFDTSEFKRKFSSLERSVNDPLMSIEKPTVPDRKDLMSKLEESVSRQQSEQKEF